MATQYMLECSIPPMSDCKYGVLDDCWFQPYITDQDVKITIDLAQLCENQCDHHIARSANNTDNEHLIRFFEVFNGTPIIRLYRHLILMDQFNPMQEMTYGNYWTFLSIRDVIDHITIHANKFYDIAVGHVDPNSVRMLAYVPVIKKFFVYERTYKRGVDKHIHFYAKDLKQILDSYLSDIF